MFERIITHKRTADNPYKMKPIHLQTKNGSPSSIFSPCSKSACLVILVFIMQNITVSTALPSVDYQGNKTDHTALLAIKKQLSAPNGFLSSWNDSIHHCSWEGVTCGRKHNRVTVLELGSKGLVGTISPFIGNLSFLQIIKLYNNSLSCEIPTQLTHLYRLRKLWLYNNTLVGEIPANISRCVNLRVLFLGNNKLEGKLPTGLGALRALENLGIHQNYLTGPLFDIIQNITSLVYISVAENSFTGTIPDCISRMRNLQFLGAAENKLSGTLPASLFNLSSLTDIDFPNNQLHGELPARLGLTVPRLTWLNLVGNNISGSIPVTISNLTSLERLELSQNGFIGRVPHGLGNLRDLITLDLSDNHLVHNINFITTLVNCSQLDMLSVDGNEFHGILPESIANLSTTLTWLSIGDSLISGTLPAGITNLINLQNLLITNCELKSSLPHDFGKLQKLEAVDLHSNKLTGKIPNSVGNLSRVSRLYLLENMLEGSIPESIGNCQSLLYLDLQTNHLSGFIPSELFDGAAKYVGIYLSQNHLEGSLPLEISRQINLVEFEVSSNRLSGLLTDGLSDCLSLQYLGMDGNFFHGHIPPSFAHLTSLEHFDVSRNHLSGQIPVYLYKFPLTYLNLSYNDFEGVVPTIGVFANASSIFLVGNNRLCGGIQELHLPKCVKKKTLERKKRSLSYTLKKVVISTACAVAVVGVFTMSLAFYQINKRNKRRATTSTSMTGKTFMNVSYNSLLKATSGFSSENLLGEGSFGSVFKGVLDGNMIAVKVLNLQRFGASKSFIAECKTLRNVRHRNLVGIITACSSIDFQRNDFRALVYEFMPNGSLDRWLVGSVGNMNLAQRLDVAIDVAHALNYLHHECETAIVHCDLKPSNILLDNEMVAHVGDFGLSKFLTQPQHPNQSSTIGIRGTIGYAAPEYGLGSEPSTDGDVYSYGILLLELMTGKSPTDAMFKEDYNLHIHAEAALPEQVLQITDPSLEEDNLTDEADDKMEIKDALQRKVECIVSVISVGVSCSNHLPHDRMKITEAISKLQSARDNFLNTRKRHKRPLFLPKEPEDDFHQENRQYDA